MECSVPYPSLAGVPEKLGDAALSGEYGSVWREHTGVVRIAFQEDRGVTCYESFLQLLLNFVNIVADGICSGIRAILGPAGGGADRTTGKEKDHDQR